MTKTFKIARRAYSNHTVVELFSGSWVDATLRAMDLEHQNKDGEYMVWGADETPGWRPGSSYQSPMDWL